MKFSRGFPAIALSLLSCQFSSDKDLEGPEGETSVVQITSGRSGEDKDPDVSPDGKTLFYVSSSYSDRMDLYMKTIHSSTAVRLTDLQGDKRFPKVNRVDPRFLAFCTNARGPWEIAITDLKTHPSRVEFVSDPETHSLHPSWSPDGRMLTYCSTGDLSRGEWTLKVHDFVTHKTHSFEDVDGLLPDWSPFGSRIVFQRMKHRDRWFSSLWTMDFEGGSARNLTVLFSSDDWAAINPSWSPDGRSVVFATVAKSKARAEVFNEGDDVWSIRADGSFPTRLTTSPAADWMPTWASDGHIYFVSNRSGSNRIWSLLPPMDPLHDPSHTLLRAGK